MHVPFSWGRVWEGDSGPCGTLCFVIGGAAPVHPPTGASGHTPRWSWTATLPGPQPRVCGLPWPGSGLDPALRRSGRHARRLWATPASRTASQGSHGPSGAHPDVMDLVTGAPGPQASRHRTPHAFSRGPSGGPRPIPACESPTDPARSRLPGPQSGGGGTRLGRQGLFSLGRQQGWA